MVAYRSYMSLLKIGGEWKLVNKIFVAEPKQRGYGGCARVPIGQRARFRVLNPSSRTKDPGPTTVGPLA
jgi:hypothetical protein